MAGDGLSALKPNIFRMRSTNRISLPQSLIREKNIGMCVSISSAMGRMPEFTKFKNDIG